MTASGFQFKRESGRAILPVAAAAFLAFVAGFPAGVGNTATVAVGVAIPDSPVFVVAENKPNVLFVLDNSNSMDEAASGAAVGSNSPESKSEIARDVLEGVLGSYQDRMSVGLMAYKQNTPIAGYLHNSPYDASYNPSNYDPAFTGARSSATKRQRQLKPGSTTEYVYYNVALPFYSNRNEGTLFCYSSTASFDNGSEQYPAGPWDDYYCYTGKAGASDAAPNVSGSGYTGLVSSRPYRFSPTDSDLAQNILDFGRRMASYYVSRTWYVNDSPGRGYLHVPIKPLDATQSAALLSKLACNVPDAPAPCTSDGIKNAGLTPIEGTLNTAKDYFAGGWTDSTEGYTSSAYPLPVTCAKNYVILLTDGLPSTDASGTALTDPAAAIQQAAAAAANLKAAGVTVYVIGFAMPIGTDGTTLNQIATAGGTEQAFLATDQASLNAAVESIFASIDAEGGSSGGTVTNSTSLDDNTRIYQASFNPADWSGAIKGYEFTNSVIDEAPSWNATIPAAASRTIYMYNGAASDGTKRSSFTWAGLTTAQQTAFGSQAVFDYIRGVRTGEGTTYRARSSLLGDVVYSTPAYVQEVASGTLPAMKLLMVGANDGMFHAFNGDTGVETFAYVPRGIDFATLKNLSAKSYNKAHKYFVDGPVVVSTREETNNRNIVVGTLGRGGRGAYAIDVTNPVTPKVLWDLTGSAAPDGMGKVLGAPFFGKYMDGNTLIDAVFVPNGVTAPGATYTGADQASLFILNAVTGAVVRQMTAIDNSDPATVSNGLSAPKGWDDDGDEDVDFVYAGDLRGNIWRFDLASNQDRGVQRFQAARGTPALRQPISGGVSVSMDPVNFKRWIHFGTGQFLTNADFSNRDVQTIYGFWDDGGTSKLTRSDLKSRSIIDEQLVNGRPVRVFEANAAQDLSKKGWYIDLLDPISGAEGERVTGSPQDVSGQLRVSSGIPGSSACKPAGGGFIYFLDAYTGTSTPRPAVDANGDGKVDNDDKVDGRNPGGIGEDIGLHGDGTQTGDVVTVGGSEDKRRSRKIYDDAARGRLSWRELIRD